MEETCLVLWSPFPWQGDLSLQQGSDFPKVLDLGGSTSRHRTTNPTPVDLFTLRFAASEECGLTQDFSLGSFLSISSWSHLPWKEEKERRIWTSGGLSVGSPDPGF